MKNLSPIKKILFPICLATAISPTSLWGARNNTQTTQPPPIFSSLWETPHLYHSKDAPFLQKIKLVGRYHGQYWYADSEENSAQDWENRRMYVGFQARFLEHFTLEIQASLNDDFDPIYKGLYDAFIKWQDSEDKVAVSFGRLDYVYTGMERSTSSKKIKTMERALLVNQLMPGEVIGLYMNSKTGDFSYQTGLFSGSIKKEFTDFRGGFAALLGIGYNLPLFYESGSLHLDYLYNNANAKNNAFKAYENIISLWHKGEKGALAVGIDLTAASGIDDQSDVFGLTLLPSYDLAHNLLMGNDKLQLAMRYHYASSSDEYGLQFNKRYEQPVTSGKGDAYSAVYCGLNYFLYQHRLKLMGGIEYFTMADASNLDDEPFDTADRRVAGWIGSGGFRLYF